jgi:hypothetical protein
MLLVAMALLFVIVGNIGRLLAKHWDGINENLIRPQTTTEAAYASLV